MSEASYGSFLGLRLHAREPENPTKLRAYTGSLLMKDMKAREGLNHYTDHEIAQWYGVSFKLKWFVGVWVFGKTNHPAERGPVPYSGAPAEREG